MKDIYYCLTCEKFVDHVHKHYNETHHVAWIPPAAVEAIKADKHLPPPEMPDTVFISRNPSNKALQVFTVRDVGEAEYRRVKPCECDGVQIVGGNYCWKCGGRVAE